VALIAGQVKNGDIIAVAFDGTNYEILNQIRSHRAINAQTGTTYTVLTSDRGGLVTLTNAAAIAVTLPQATSAGAFSSGFWTELENISTSSLVTITPTTSTINGAASLIVYPGQRYTITSDGTNYRAVKSGSDIWRYSAKTANYTLLPADVKPTTVFDFTTSTTTLSTNVAASNFTGGIFAIRNSAATGDVTFDPNGAETIDGAASLLIHPGQTFWVQCDGTNWKSIADNVLQKSSAIASKTGNYTATTADRGKSIRFAGLAADATLTLPAAATCGDGFILYVSNEDTTFGASGPWALTIDPNGAELLDGSASRKCHTGSRLTLLCDGTGWRTVGGEYIVITGRQTISSGDDANIAHGNGVAPKRVWVMLECITTEGGWAVGDFIFGMSDASSGANLGYTWGGDATNLFFVIASGGAGRLFNKTTGAIFTLTPANWALRLAAAF
jgi:hypothetical protein